MPLLIRETGRVSLMPPYHPAERYPWQLYWTTPPRRQDTGGLSDTLSWRSIVSPPASSAPRRSPGGRRAKYPRAWSTNKTGSGYGSSRCLTAGLPSCSVHKETLYFLLFGSCPELPVLFPKTKESGFRLFFLTAPGLAELWTNSPS